MPPGALDAAAIEQALLARVRSWSEKWCAHNGPRLLGPFAPAAAGAAVAASTAKPGPGEALRWQVLEGGTAVGVADRATGALAGSILDADLRETSLTAADRALIDRVASDCLEELREAVADLFAEGGERKWRPAPDFEAPAGGWFGKLGIKDREPLIHIVVPRARVIAFHKSSIRAGETAVPLQPLAEGLRKQQIALSAHIGRCAMTLSDFTALAAGDVLVMDRDLDEPLQLAVDGDVKGGSCIIEEREDRMLLKISNPLGG